MEEDRGLSRVVPEDPLQAVDLVFCQLAERERDPQLLGPAGAEVGPADLHAHDLGRLVAQVEAPPDDHDGVVLEQGPVVGHDAGEHKDLHGGLEVF